MKLLTALVILNILLFADVNSKEDNSNQNLQKGLELLKEKKIKKAEKLLKKACDKGIGEGCFHLGRIYDNGIVVKKDYTKAIAFYKEAIKKDYPKAYASLGIMYSNGKGVKVDNKKALELFIQSCDKNSSFGCTNLG